MLTVAILGIIIAIVAPRFSLQKTTVKTVSRQAEALFVFAKTQAIAQQKEITVSINITEAGELSRMSVIDYGLSTDNVLDIYIPDDEVVISFNPNISEIIFSPTQAIRVKAAGVTSLATKPISIYLDNSAEPNLILFPNSGKVLEVK